MAGRAPQLPAGEREVPEVARLLQEGLRARLADACCLVASVRGSILHRQAAGLAEPPPRRAACAHSTLFDLGPLTMPLGAGLAALWLVGQRRLDLGARLGGLLPGLAASPYAGATVDMLLDHTSGLPAEAPLHAQLAEAQRHLHPKERSLGSRRAQPALIAAVAALPAEAPPGQRAVVSQVGGQVLGWVVERVAGEPLDSLLAARVWAPLGVADEVMFLPAEAPARRRQRAVCGPPCPVRRRPLRGEVRDLNAWAAGGVAGHAGLFASATGAWAVMQSLLAAHGGNGAIWHPATVARFWSRSQRGGAGRTLGWAQASNGRPSAGGRLAAQAVGHDAPGMGLWCDPARQAIAVLLAARHDGAAREPESDRLQARIYHAVAQAAAVGPSPLDALEALGLLRDPPD